MTKNKLIIVAGTIAFLLVICLAPMFTGGSCDRPPAKQSAQPRGGSIYNPGGGGGAGLATAGSAGIVNFNNGTATTASRSDHTHRTIRVMSWYFPGSPATGVNNMVLNFPEGITNATILDMRATTNTLGGTNSTFNIQRCTATCTGAATFADIYSTVLTLSTGVRTVTKGTPPNQNVSSLAAGDQFKVNLVTIGTSIADVTVTMTWSAEITN